MARRGEASRSSCGSIPCPWRLRRARPAHGVAGRRGRVIRRRRRRPAGSPTAMTIHATRPVATSIAGTPRPRKGGSRPPRRDRRPRSASPLWPTSGTHGHRGRGPRASFLDGPMPSPPPAARICAVAAHRPRPARAAPPTPPPCTWRPSPGSAMTVTPTPLSSDPHRKLRWLAPPAVLFRAERRFAIESLPAGRTLSLHDQHFRPVGAGPHARAEGDRTASGDRRGAQGAGAEGDA